MDDTPKSSNIASTWPCREAPWGRPRLGGAGSVRRFKAASLCLKRAERITAQASVPCLTLQERALFYFLTCGLRSKPYGRVSGGCHPGNAGPGLLCPLGRSHAIAIPQLFLACPFPRSSQPCAVLAWKFKAEIGKQRSQSKCEVMAS